MLKFTDTLGNEVGYLPIVQTEGTDSQTITLRASVPEGNPGTLRASFDADVKLMGRVGAAGAFVDLNASPISLAPFSGTIRDFQFFTRAGEVTGFRRVNLSLGAARGGAADW